MPRRYRRSEYAPKPLPCSSRGSYPQYSGAVGARAETAGTRGDHEGRCTPRVPSALDAAGRHEHGLPGKLTRPAWQREPASHMSRASSRGCPGTDRSGFRLPAERESINRSRSAFQASAARSRRRPGGWWSERHHPPAASSPQAPHRRAQIDTNDTPHTVNALPAPHRVTRKPVARSVANGRNGTIEKDPYVERCDVSSDVETAGSGVQSCS